MLPTKVRFIWSSDFRGEMFLEIFLCNCLAKWTETWWEAPIEGYVLSSLKAEWKVSDWASSSFCQCVVCPSLTLSDYPFGIVKVSYNV
jgi:hypothetical protein